MYMVGSILQSFFTLGCGLARNANEIIIFRALSGVAIAFCLPSAVSIITSTLDGKRRNFAFASMGGGQPVGFSIGLTLGGVLTDSIGWRWGFYLAAILNTIVVAGFVAMFSIIWWFAGARNKYKGPRTQDIMGSLPNVHESVPRRDEEARDYSTFA
jgi:MFS family permease